MEGQLKNRKGEPGKDEGNHQIEGSRGDNI